MGHRWYGPSWPIFSRFGCIWSRKVHFSTFSAKLTFQCRRNGPQNPPFCPGSFQNTFIIYSSISPQYIFQKYFSKTKSRESENMKFQKNQVTNKCPIFEGTLTKPAAWRRLRIA